MECPRCGLFSPEGAQRGDCGYDFAWGKVDDKHFKEALPPVFKTYYVLLVIYFTLVWWPVRLTGSDALVLVGAWIFLVVLLWFLLRVKKNDRARIALVLLTFPVGLLLASQQVKRYCHEIMKRYCLICEK